MAITIDQLQIEIQARSTGAASGIDALTASLGKLRSAVKGGVGLTTATKQFQAFAQAVQTMQAPTQKIAELVAALKPLETIGKSNLGSALNQLKKIPDITAGLDDAKLSAFAAKIQQVTVAVRPLAAEMEKVSAGFSKLPANIQRAINANARLTRANKTTAFGFNMLAAKISIVYVAMRRVASVIGGWIKESNDYVENLNLFTVAMGEYAHEAQKYAEHAGDVLGIDPSEWMRNQGIFMTLLTGFGNAADRAALMSKNLTQLGYDLSSFFNISFEDAMQKLQSGVSGELEPLRRLGYDLSQAKLQAIALSQGIDRSVASMTQAEKSQLRYYAIMTQVTTAQGDMARTLQAPANQLRILQAQATQAARALGNIFIPALNAILPYAIAFLKVIRWVAQEIANLFGFSLPEIDYSGVQGITGAGEDAADALDSAGGSAKKLKGLLAGFDQLNIIQQEPATGGGGGGGASGISGGDLGLKLPEYDFLGGLIDSKVSKIFEDMLKWAKRLLPILKKIAPVLAGLWAAKKLIEFATWIKNLTSLMGTAGLTGKLATVASALTGLFAGIALGGLVTYIAYIALADAGMEDLGIAIGLVVVAIGIAVAAWGIFTGSVGAAFFGVGLMIGAVIGLVTAQEQLMTEKVSEWFYAYSDGSITITQLADAYGKMADEIVARKQPIIDGFDAYEQGKESVAKTSQELDALLQSVQYNTDSIKDKLPEIKAAFEGLLSGTRETLSALKNNIILSLAGATGEAYTAMGGDLANIYALLDETFGAANDTVEANKKKIDELTEQYNKGDISESAFITGLIDAKAIISSLTQESIPEVDNFKIAAQTAFDGIDFENSEAVSEALGIFSEKTQAAKNAILEAAGAEYGQLEEVKRLIQALDISLTPEQEQALKDWEESITKAIKIDTAKIDEQFNTAASAISANLVTAMQGVAEEASAKWNNMNPLEKWFAGGNEAAYVETALTNYRNTIVNPVQQKLIEANGAIGADVAGQTDSIMDDIMVALFDYSLDGMGDYVSGFKTDVESAFKKPLEELGEAIPLGVAGGVNKNTSEITNATKDAAQKGIDAFASTQESNSPARKYAQQGKYAVQGFKQGVEKNASTAIDAIKKAAKDSINAFAREITSNRNTVADSMKSLSESMTRPLDDVINRMGEIGARITNGLITSINSMAPNVRQAFESMFNNIHIKLPHFSVSGSFDVKANRVPSINVNWYAQGGFPVPGELFIANESGPEMVGTMGGRTAVANNDQIVEGVASGVSAANAEQNALLREQNRLLMRLLEKEGTVVFPTSVEAGRAVQKSINMYNVARGVT